ncbi:hypothetical protein AR158_c565R [Paramecium bursaria Chlorella virus AR158]|uniref:hypothetical protein n=1 Tax=Paramecium bursaria Chlorella virus AR158 TaxID=380598 RepID=UPI00015AA783|nr:hypothetical protein AR158_c565R [Paramecium bursaria Chlorella virus AR158]ABU44110.1 hypothetical protein AR158_c565R [Paramecium bursaria Chlorella virus AR158]
MAYWFFELENNQTTLDTSSIIGPTRYFVTSQCHRNSPFLCKCFFVFDIDLNVFARNHRLKFCLFDCQIIFDFRCKHTELIMESRNTELSFYIIRKNANIYSFEEVFDYL